MAFASSGSFYTAIFTLPAGYRPAARTLFTVWDNGNSGRVDVLPSGEVEFEFRNPTYHGLVALDGISFVPAG